MILIVRVIFADLRGYWLLQGFLNDMQNWILANQGFAFYQEGRTSNE